ncbi:lysophospholipid acyltransferase family protein [Alphaproteobacteria bacterium]|nr:lysophospholipid acyltransferase family protein [Alphaproteobacteria bacterium]
MADPLSFRLKKLFDRYIHDPISALLAIPLFLILKILPYKISSYLCGALMLIIAPLTSYNNRVKKHMKIAFPKKSITEINNLSRKHWFMLGQTIGEMPHINKMIQLDRLKTEGLEKIKTGPAILVGAHMGNWEFLLRVGDLAGRRAGYVFRPINNWILNKIQIKRNEDANADFYRKGRLAAIGMAGKLKAGEVVGLTGDQLLREGIMVPFFGIDTPTPQAAAIMSLKWNIPIYMVRIERLDGIRFKMTIEDKLKIPKNQSKDKAIYEITKLISSRIEKWIINQPEQWLWAHRRWGK